MAMPVQTYRSTVSATQDQLDDLVLALLSPQGQWSQETYLWLSEHTNRLIEFTDGYIEVVPIPTDEHQTILASLYQMFFAGTPPSWFSTCNVPPTLSTASLDVVHKRPPCCLTALRYRSTPSLMPHNP
jgi:hypothetical protein